MAWTKIDLSSIVSVHTTHAIINDPVYVDLRVCALIGSSQGVAVAVRCHQLELKLL